MSPARHRDHRWQCSCWILQVHGAETVPGEEQGTPQGLARSRASRHLKIANDVHHGPRGQVLVLSHEGVGKECDSEVVELLVHVGQPSSVQRGRLTRLAQGRERQTPLPFKADRCSGAVALAGVADPIVAVTHRLVQGRVDSASNEVVVDQPIALSQRQPLPRALKMRQSGLRPDVEGVCPRWESPLRTPTNSPVGAGHHRLGAPAIPPGTPPVIALRYSERS